MDGFEKYERDYVDRVSKRSPETTESREQASVRRHKDLVESAEKAARGSKLDAWDYAILDMVRREDFSACMVFGTLKTHESLLKLHCHCLIRPLDREPTFDETERAHAFLDSAAFKRYKDRLKKIMTKDVKDRLDLISEILGVSAVTYMVDLTDEGRETLHAKRKEFAVLHEKMRRQYVENRAEFYESAQSYEWALPMMFSMGLTGPMMAYMLASSDAQYAALGHAGAQWADFGHDVHGFGDSDSGLDGDFCIGI